ncbi:cyclase family protein [Sulfolobus sp. E5-1-F]|uniref:cyclase family protein n=1 Tax=Saccharolobus sp. E5-1-F TaxID=2663019 RepID=UPI0012977D06|nr:cyclase family protein [Sulfolobus sp. E5-1-F]QGA53977.1 cyclase family protein [Sulfolobus sp. E5-1-F]
MEEKVTTLEELLKDSPTNWRRWGNDDEVGALNFNEVLRGIKAVRQGKVFTLQVIVGSPKGDPVWPGRTSAIRINVNDKGYYMSGKNKLLYGGLEYADDIIIMFLQGTTQIDALGHTWYGDKIWNGYSAMETIGGLSKASVLPIAQRGIVGHGVLIDVARCKGVESLSPGEEITLNDLLSCAKKEGIEIQKHDILLIRTGWIAQYFKKDPAEFYKNFVEPGLTYRKELIEWFHNMEIPVLGTDTIGNERTTHPDTGIVLPLHAALMRNLGVVFNEILWLEDLAEDCSKDGQWDFLYVGAPLKATGAPINPVVIK